MILSAQILFLNELALNLLPLLLQVPLHKLILILQLLLQVVGPEHETLVLLLRLPQGLLQFLGVAGAALTEQRDHIYHFLVPPLIADERFACLNHLLVRSHILGHYPEQIHMPPHFSYEKGLVKDGKHGLLEYFDGILFFDVKKRLPEEIQGVPGHVSVPLIQCFASNFNVFIEYADNLSLNERGHGVPMVIRHRPLMHRPLHLEHLPGLDVHTHLPEGLHELELLVVVHVRIHPKLLDLFILNQLEHGHLDLIF